LRAKIELTFWFSCYDCVFRVIYNVIGLWQQLSVLCSFSNPASLLSLGLSKDLVAAYPEHIPSFFPVHLILKNKKGLVGGGGVQRTGQQQVSEGREYWND
jgi:hypothetical protein